MRVLLITPPLTQVNTPYPATAYLTGYLRARDYDVRQADVGLELVLRLFSRQGLEGVPGAERFIETVEPVVRFLQGRDPTLAVRIASRGFLPEGPRFAALDQDEEALPWAFGALGVTDQAKHLASLYLDDLADLIREKVDSRFEFSRYGEKLAASRGSFDELDAAVRGEGTLVDRILEGIVEDLEREHQPDFVGLSVPFPGNVYGGFRMARKWKSLRPDLPIALGGGYVNTELRSLSDPRVFDFVDYVTLDDGERALELLLESVAGRRPAGEWLRTAVRRDGRVEWISAPGLTDVPFRETPAPSYEGLKLDQYLSLFEMLNPLNRLWTDYRWNKLTLAHGCYWRKCSFCDTSLDYIGRYEVDEASRLVDKMEAVIRETGSTGFHFVDEAAPPAMLRALSEEILRRGLVVSWWGNIRFEKAFTPALCQLMAEAGCIAVTGGLEVASERILKLINKGVSVPQVRAVTRAFADAGIFVHAYLMYGFPTQTREETVESLEVVRRLFADGCIHSAFWHRFACTVHSPVGREPEKYGIRLRRDGAVSRFGVFAVNDLEFEDPTGVDHERLGVGLRKAVYNYMHGVGLDTPVADWF